MATVKHKVLAYITHRRRLLVFSHPYSPEAGIQVAGGTVGEGEAPDEAVMREAAEETGLEGLRLQAYLGAFEQAVCGRGEVWRRHCYHLTVEEEPPERWRHEEADPADGSPGPIILEFFWVRVPHEVPQLAPGHEVMLPKLAGVLVHR